MDISPITISEACRRLGKEGNPKLIKALLKNLGISPRRIGPSNCIDHEEFLLLANAVKAWDERPTISRLRAGVSSAV